MFILHGKLLNTEEMEARGNFPPSGLLTVFDEDASDTIKLMAPKPIYEALRDKPKLTEVRLRVRWRKIELRSLGGSGNAYRLTVVGLDPGGSK